MYTLSRLAILLYVRCWFISVEPTHIVYLKWQLYIIQCCLLKSYIVYHVAYSGTLHEGLARIQDLSFPSCASTVAWAMSSHIIQIVVQNVGLGLMVHFIANWHMKGYLIQLCTHCSLVASQILIQKSLLFLILYVNMFSGFAGWPGASMQFKCKSSMEWIWAVDAQLDYISFSKFIVSRYI